MFFLCHIKFPLSLRFYRSHEATDEIYLLLLWLVARFRCFTKLGQKNIHSLSQCFYSVCIKHLFPAHQLWSGFAVGPVYP